MNTIHVHSLGHLERVYTLNGGHIHRNGIVIRGTARPDWWDAEHRAVMAALYALEAALKELDPPTTGAEA